MATIITKNSTGSGVTPSSLIQGELAINVVDGKLFYGSGSGNAVKEFSTNTGSLLTTASVSLNTITFTKGDGSTFPITVNTGSGGGGSTFPYTGSAIISGSLTVTGSFYVSNSIDSVNRQLTDNLSKLSIDWQSRALRDSTEFGSVDWENRAIYDSAGGESINWNARRITDDVGNVSVQYQDRQLFANDGATPALDWRTVNQLTVTGHLIPGGTITDNTSSYDLGSATAAWRDLYVSNGSIKMISGSQSASISFTNGALDFGTTPISSPDVIATASVSSNTITFTKGDGTTFPITIDTGSGGSNQTILQKAAAGYEYFNDFLLTLAANNATDGRGLAAIFSGTGASLTLSPTPSVRASNQQGFLQFNTGTVATGYTGVYGTSVANNFLMLGGGIMTYITSVFIPTLSTSVERFRVTAGYGTTATGVAETNGVFFTYDEGGTQNGTAASPYWQCVTVAGGVRTLTTTTVLVSNTAWKKLTIQTNAGGTSVGFYIDNVLVATHTTNIPSGTSQLVTPKLQIVKTVGTTSRAYYADYIGYEQTFTTPRI